MKKILAIIIIIFTIIQVGCRKDEITTDSSAKLSFSSDTLIVDTVFTTIGSTTKRLVVYNRNNRKVNISQIYVEKGAGSEFRINVDGASGNTHENIEIEANDSIFIFVEVTIDPTNNNNPFVIEENLHFVTNGNNQEVLLVAWGQDAHYFTPKVFPTSGLPDYTCLDGNCDTSQAPVNITWTNDKPYVIYGYLIIDENDVLNIDAGVNVHLYNGAGIWVFKGGNLNINGTKDEPVTFQGVRLDYSFEDIPGQWDRIWVNEGSTDNVFNYAVIKNSFIGIQAEADPFDASSVLSSNKLILNECEIHNASGVGLFGKNFQIESRNSIISNCGQYNFLVTGGGLYNFNHTTFANYWEDVSRETPAIYLQNYFVDGTGTAQVRNIDTAYFNNCILHGNIDNEFDLETISPGEIKYQFSNSVVRTTKSTNNFRFDNVSNYSGSNVFINPLEHDYHITSSSAANNIGVVSSITTDKDGNARNNPPDAGAYEN